MSKDTVDAKEIRPVTKSEAKQIYNNFEQLAIAIQTFSNALQRQALTNIGTIALYEENTTKTGYSTLTDGLGSRLTYQAFATYPALLIRKTLSDRGDIPMFAINLASTATESALGTPLEINSTLKTLEHLGVKLTKKDLLTASSRAYIPFFARTLLGWYAINMNANDNLAVKIGYGGLAGAISTPFHNIGMKAAEYSVGKTWEETGKILSEEIRSKPTSFLRGVKPRSISIAATALLLSPQTNETFTKICEDIFSGPSPMLSGTKTSKQLEETTKNIIQK